MDFSTEFGLAPWKLIVCPQCIEGEMSIGVKVHPPPPEIERHSSWCSAAICSQCGYTWYICMVCAHSTALLDTKRKVMNHAYKYHRQNTEPEETPIPTAKKRKTPSSAMMDSIQPIQPDDSSLSNVSSFIIHRDNLLNDNGINASIPLDNQQPHVLPEVAAMDFQTVHSPTAIDNHDFSNILETDTPCPEDLMIATIVDECNFSRQESRNYFINNYKQSNGTSYLVAQSFYKDYRLPRNTIPDEMDLCLQLSLFVRSLSTAQSNTFGDILENIFSKIGLNEGTSTVTNGVSNIIGCPPRLLPLPQNRLEIRSKIKDGRDSFLNLIPHPLIRQLKDGHVYVLPSDCILHFLAHGQQPLEFNQLMHQYPVRQLNQSARGVEVAQTLSKVNINQTNAKKHFQLSFLEWKDDCEPNKSNNESKFSLWLFTITIFTKDMLKDSSAATFPIAIGPKSADHNEIEKIIAGDYNRMRSNAIPAFLGSRENNPATECTFSAELYMSLGDQPERRGGNYMTMGNSRTHARWRVALDYEKVLDVIPACPACLELMVKCDSAVTDTVEPIDRNQWKHRKCEVCTNWAEDISDPRLQFRRSKDFPKDYVLGGEPGSGDLYPIEITYDVLKKVLDLTFLMVSTGRWGVTKAVQYLTDNCICESYARITIFHATNVLKLNQAKEDPDDFARYRKLLHHKQLHPDYYEQLTYPSLYQRGLPLYLFADTPMHLIFLGVCKSVFRRVSTWSGRRGRKSTYVKIGKSLINQLDSLKLSWMLFVPNTFCAGWGGWVSKHYASLSRVALWVFGPLMSIDDAPPYIEPQKPPDKWIVTELREWLQARGLDDSGNKPQLQPRVLNYLRGPPEKIPPVIPSLYGSAGDMLSMVQSLVILVTTLFQDELLPGSVELITLRIRIFLTRFDQFDRPMRDANTKPTWLSSYNFLCLLNLPENIRLFGPPRRWFEGKWLGERYVSALKSSRVRSGPKNVYSNMMKKLHQNKFLDTVNASAETVMTIQNSLKINTKIYTNIDNFRHIYCTRKPLPIIILESNTYGFAFYNSGRNIGKQISIGQIRMQEIVEEEAFHHGLKYFKFTLMDAVKTLDEVLILDYAVLLPRLGCATEGIYTIVTKNWSTTMLGNDVLSSPMDHSVQSCSAFNNALHTLKRDDASIVGAHWI